MLYSENPLHSDKHNDSEEQEQAAQAKPLLKRVDGVENAFKEEKEHRVHLEAKMDRMEEALDRLMDRECDLELISFGTACSIDIYRIHLI